MSPPVIDAGLPVRAFFTTRWGGVSTAPYDSFNVAGHVRDDAKAVQANRSRLIELAGAPIAYMAQKHGNIVMMVSDPDELPEADAIVTRRSHLALAVLVADCVPLLMVDAGSGAVGAVHAGRSGVALGIIRAAVAGIREAGGRRSGRISAAIGPSICGGCYEVPEAMREEVARLIPEAWAETTWGTPSLDLRAAVRAQMEEAGVEEIGMVGPCTFESPDLFSFRRDGLTGRTAGIIRCE